VPLLDGAAEGIKVGAPNLGCGNSILDALDTRPCRLNATPPEAPAGAQKGRSARPQQARWRRVLGVPVAPLPATGQTVEPLSAAITLQAGTRLADFFSIPPTSEPSPQIHGIHVHLKLDGLFFHLRGKLL
jgi:hypothetical protein